jgi:hypothetical protein
VANNFIAGTTTFASQDIGGVQYEKVKEAGTTIANMANVAPTTSTTTIRIAANPDRREIEIRNTGAVEVRLHATSGFTLVNGFPISPGDGFSSYYTGAFYIATASGTGSINYWEDVNG